MEKLKSSGTMLVLFAGIAIISASSITMNEALAKPHASLLIPIENGPPNLQGYKDQNILRVVLGHTNEPSFGKLPGIHDGKHFLEVTLSDDATTLPVRTATLSADKFYFKDVKSFLTATSPEQADQIEYNVPVSAVFGQPGLFYDRQVQDPGIYGYTLRGVVNYYDVVDVPIEDTTVFCRSQGLTDEENQKFNSPGWQGAYGCTENIKDIFFPTSKGEPYPESGSYKEYPEDYPSSEY